LSAVPAPVALRRDYAIATVALCESDSLQDCIEAVKARFLNDPLLVRRLPALLRSRGFEVYGFIGFASFIDQRPR
jgi:hypothetical protein